MPTKLPNKCIWTPTGLALYLPTIGGYTHIDDIDQEVVERHYWGTVCSSDLRVYAYTVVDAHRILMQRLILLEAGLIGKMDLVRHKDGNGLNNTRGNLTWKKRPSTPTLRKGQLTIDTGMSMRDVAAILGIEKEKLYKWITFAKMGKTEYEGMPVPTRSPHGNFDYRCYTREDLEELAKWYEKKSGQKGLVEEMFRYTD
jgi:hypothetical protein